MISRRKFFKQSEGLLALGATAPLLWRQAAQASERRRDLPVLVVLELTGGNDGLNTVIPHADDVYHKSRPTLRVEPAKVLKLDDHVGLHPALKDIHRLWETGCLTVVQGVGYPNPSRSHFRSMEIWQTGAIGPAPPAGWLGRLSDGHPGMELCHIGEGTMPLALVGRTSVAQSLASIAAYQLQPGAALTSRFTEQPSVPELKDIRRRYTATVELTRRLENLRKEPNVRVDADTLEGRLETVLRLIEADTPLRVFYTAQDGFDTHGGQLYAHQQLLQTVGKAVAGFLQGIKERKVHERVLVLVFSEFGRRLKENSSGGTDHGTCAPVLLAGSPVKGGILGPHPSLADLDETGDPRFVHDFRDLYSTIIGHWLDVDPVPILGDRHGNLPVL
jgi:uncharacterized protein (DUF1501 family)